MGLYTHTPITGAPSVSVVIFDYLDLRCDLSISNQLLADPDQKLCVMRELLAQCIFINDHRSLDFAGLEISSEQFDASSAPVPASLAYQHGCAA
jgi:hypothetical protein